jgi:SAM-dependent methyltransferase
MAKDYLSIVSECEGDLEKYGDCYLGVGWTKKAEYAATRYRVMLDVIKAGRSDKISLLDFGCGASHLYEYILRHGLDHIQYSGLDLSQKFLDLSRTKFPDVDYHYIDVLSDPKALPQFDYIILNGVFNSKCKLSFEWMFSYWQQLIAAVFDKARVGIAFNVMSKQVDWERDDLFHLPFDMMATYLTKSISRYFIIRHDYGLWEYTTYVYRENDFESGAG